MCEDRPKRAVSVQEIVDWRQRQRVAGRTVALTNGCFDLLHAGHVKLLAAARKTADRLIVAINDDASVRQIKGPDRPLVPGEERAELLAAMEPVDRVVMFSEATPLRIILAVKPDVLVKGSDWSEERIIGAKEVRADGGRVVRFTLENGVSTSGLLQRIRERYGAEG